MDVIYRGAEYAANIFDAMTALVFLTAILGKRDQVKSKRLFGIAMLLFVFVLSYFQDVSDNVLVQFASVIILELLFEYAFLKGSLGTRAVYVMLNNMVLIISNLLTVHGMSFLLGCGMEMLCAEGSVLRIFVLIINKILILLMLLVIVFIGKKNQFEIQEWLIAVLMFIGTLSTGAVLANIAKSGKISVYEEAGLVIVALALLIISIGILFCLYKLNRQHYYKIENQLLNAKLDDEKFMIEKIGQFYEDNRILRHDLKHYFTVLQGMLYSNSTEEMAAYLENVVDSKFDGNQVYRTNSSIINSILNDRAAICQKNQILFEVQISGQVPETIQINLGIILSNLLDNAIEAELEERCEKRVSIKMYWEQEMFLIQISNHIDRSVLQTNPNLLTSKMNRGMHGLGIKSVKKLVKEMNGEYYWEEENNNFVVRIIFSNITKCAT